MKGERFYIVGGSEKGQEVMPVSTPEIWDGRFYVACQYIDGPKDGTIASFSVDKLSRYKPR